MPVVRSNGALDRRKSLKMPRRVAWMRHGIPQKIKAVGAAPCGLSVGAATTVTARRRCERRCRRSLPPAGAKMSSSGPPRIPEALDRKPFISGWHGSCCESRLPPARRLDRQPRDDIPGTRIQVGRHRAAARRSGAVRARAVRLRALARPVHAALPGAAHRHLSRTRRNRAAGRGAGVR